MPRDNEIAYIAMGQNYWTKRDTMEKAIAALKKECRGGMTPAKWKMAVYRCDDFLTTVDELGGFRWRKGANRPELVRVCEVTKSNGHVKDLPLESLK